MKKLATHAAKSFQLLRGFAPRPPDQRPLEPAGGTVPRPHIFLHYMQFPLKFRVSDKTLAHM